MECLYHCSPVGGLTLLKPSVTKYFGKPKQVCLTSLLPMALMYGVRHFEYTYGYTKDGAIYYEEYFPDALKKIYGGKSAHLYRCARREDMQPTSIPNEYVTAEPVPVAGEVFISDVYEALLEQARMGALDIVRWEEMSEKRRQWVISSGIEVILEKGLLHEDGDFAHYMRETYPDSWALAQKELS